MESDTATAVQNEHKQFNPLGVRGIDHIEFQNWLHRRQHCRPSRHCGVQTLTLKTRLRIHPGKVNFREQFSRGTRASRGKGEQHARSLR